MKIEIHLKRAGGTVLLDGRDISAHVLSDDIVITPGSAEGPAVVYLPLRCDQVSVTTSDAAESRVHLTIDPSADRARIGQQVQAALDAFGRGGGDLR